MEKYESSIKAVKGSAEDVYALVSDLSRVGGALSPQEFAKDVEATADECSFTVDKLGRVGVRVEERTPCSQVKYALKAQMPLGVNLYIQIKEAPRQDEGPESRVKVTLTADIPMMLKPLVGSKLQDLVDRVADVVSRRVY